MTHIPAVTARRRQEPPSLNDAHESFALGYPAKAFEDCLAINADCFEWLAKIPENSIHAVVTDPPYGVKEYEPDQLERLNNGNRGGIWRIPPSFDGNLRAPLPRFTALNPTERKAVRTFFVDLSRALLRPLRPGAHVFLASNAFLSQLVFGAMVEGGLEFRGEVIRLVQTLRGGDRPKNAEKEFPKVSSMPRGAYEPWGLFRKPMPARMKVSDCLREFQTGGLQRLQDGRPFTDVIVSERTPRRERAIVEHPSLKPQSLLRQLVHASLPLGVGVVADPFMGSGSTIAAGWAAGLAAVGTERDPEYYGKAIKAIPNLRELKIPTRLSGDNLLLELD